MSMEEVREERDQESKRLQTNKSGVKQNSLSVLLVFEVNACWDPYLLVKL